MKRFWQYLNPISRLGFKEYSLAFPLVATTVAVTLLELISIYLVSTPEAVGVYAIFVLLAVIIYFSLRDGVRGGYIATTLTISYYLYIIYSRNYIGERLSSGITTTIFLGVIYFLIASIIGGLKQLIDNLISKEGDEKKRLLTIIQQLPVGVMITDQYGQVTQVNHRIESILGVRVPLGYHIGKDDMILSGEFSGKPTTLSQSPLLHSLTTGKVVVDREFIIDRSDGRKVIISVSSSPITNRKGHIIAAASIISDITSQKELEARKDDFVNMASHELKTPITSLKLYIETLRVQLKPTQDQKQLKTIGFIENQTNRLQDLVNSLLDVSRLQTGKLVFQKDPFRLDKLVNEIVTGIRGTIKQKIVISGRKNITVKADKSRINQVIVNFLVNASKYSPENSQITIKYVVSDGQVIVGVQDQGIGIDKNQQKKVFDRLYQVTDAEEKTFPGLGLGLFISKEIIRHHRGKIWVESDKGQGSTFYFSLPI
jgi:two-component system, OmpR family, phosphate regulon sensor histidine kinase PhoR